MVRTRQGARTDPSLVRGSDQGFHNESDPNWDPLADTSSHIPAAPVYLSRQVDVSIPEVTERQGGDNIPPPVAPITGSNPFFRSCFYGTQ